MPRNIDGTYTLPTISIQGSQPNQEITTKWYNTTFKDIFDNINLAINKNITSLNTFNANSNKIVTTSTAAQIAGNLKLVKNLTLGNVPNGTLVLHDSRYSISPHKTIKQINNLNLIVLEKYANR